MVRRPSLGEIDAFIAASVELSVSYDPIGLARQTRTGFATDELVTVVGQGEAAFGRAKVALATWRHFDVGWMEVFPVGASVAPGMIVAVLVRHLGFWSINGCRVVYSVGGPSECEFGFAYGTLTNHAEAGEEIFTVAFHPDSGNVSYTIRAVSRPRAALARLGYPVTRSFQARFRRDSAAAIARAIAD